MASTREAEERRSGPSSAGDQRDGRVDAQPQRVERRGRIADRLVVPVETAEVLRAHDTVTGSWRRPPVAVESFVRASGAHACTAQNGAHWCASVVALTVADVHAALRQALLDHRVHVHERLDGDAQDALAEHLAQPLVLPGQRRGRERRERCRCPRSQFWQMSRQIDAIDGMRQRRLLPEQAEQRLLDRRPQRLVDRAVGDAVREQVGLEVEELLEPVVADERDERAATCRRRRAAGSPPSSSAGASTAAR